MHQSYRRKTRRKKRLSEHTICFRYRLGFCKVLKKRLKFSSQRMWVSRSRKGGVGSLLQGPGQ